MVGLTVLKFGETNSDSGACLRFLGQRISAASGSLSGLSAPSEHSFSDRNCSWLVHGEVRRSGGCATVIRPGAFSEAEFDDLLAEIYAWVILPWGAPGTSGIFALISADTGYQVNIERLILSEPTNVSVVSRISAPSGLVGKARAIMYFEEYSSKATGIWMQAKRQGVNPFILYAPPVNFSQEGVPTPEIPSEFLHGAKYHSAFRDESTQNEKVYPFGFVLYEVTSESALRAICCGLGKRVLVFGGSCSVSDLNLILTPTRSFYEEEMELLSELSTAAAWAYGVNCGSQDCPVDVFVSEVEQTTQDLKKLLQSEYTPLKLISFY